MQSDQGGEGSVAHWVEGEMNFFNLRKEKKRVRGATVRDRSVMGGSVISRSFRKAHSVTLLWHLQGSMSQSAFLFSYLIFFLQELLGF